MDGGRIGPSLAKPEKVDDDLPPLPESVQKFRRIVNEFKRQIVGVTDNIENLEVGKKRIEERGIITKIIGLLSNPSKEKVNIQEFDSLQVALNRSQHFSNVLKAIINPPDAATMEKNRDLITSIKDVFRQNDFNFDELDNQTKRDCLYFIGIDIDMYPYDLNPGHIISVVKTGSK